MSMKTNDVKHLSNIYNQALKQTKMPSHDGQDLSQIDVKSSKDSDNTMKATNVTGNVDNESSKDVCSKIVSQLVEGLHFGRQEPLFDDENSVEEVEEEKIEILEVDVDDPLSLSDNDTKPVKIECSTKAVDSASSTRTALRNPVVEVVTISSDTEEDDEKPLVNLVRKKSSKFGKEKKPTKSVQGKGGKDLFPANPVDKFWQLGPDPKRLQQNCKVVVDKRPFNEYFVKQCPKIKVRLNRLKQKTLDRCKQTSKDDLGLTDRKSTLNLETLKERHFSTPDDILCYVAELPNVTIEKCEESRRIEVDETSTNSETDPTTIEETSQLDIENANATTSQDDPSSLLVRDPLINVSSMEVVGAPISNDFSNKGSGQRFHQAPQNQPVALPLPVPPLPTFAPVKSGKCLLCNCKPQKDHNAFQLHLVYEHYKDRLDLMILQENNHSGVDTSIFCLCPRCGYKGSVDIVRIHFALKHDIVNQLYEEDLMEREKKNYNDYVINHEVVRQLCEQTGTGTGQNFICQVCFYFFPNLDAVENHIVDKHRDEAIKCQMLQKSPPATDRRTVQPPLCQQPPSSSTSYPVKMETEHSIIVNGSQNKMPVNGAVIINGSGTANSQHQLSLAQHQCGLCPGLIVFPGSKEFEFHLGSEHFKKELNTSITSGSPFVCKFNKCGKQFARKNFAITHLVHDHQFLKKKYAEKIQLKRVASASRQVFYCVMCNGATSMKGAGAVKKEEFATVDLLRTHLVDNHLSPTILSEYEKESQRMYLLTICPVSGCNLEMGSRSVLAEHFSVEHSSAYCCLFTDSAELEPESKLRRFQTLKCSLCDFYSLDSKMVALHRYKSHPNFLDTILEKMKLTATLKSVTVPASRKEQLVQEANRKARYCHSRDKGFGIQPTQRPLLPQRQEVNVLSEFEGIPIEPIVAPEPDVQPAQISLLKKVEDRPTLSSTTEGNLQQNSVTPTLPVGPSTSSILKTFRREKKVSDSVPTSGPISDLVSVVTPVHNKENQQNDEISKLTELHEQRKLSGVKNGGIYHEQVKRIEQVKKINSLDEHVPSCEDMMTVHTEVTNNSRCQICLQNVWTPDLNKDRRKIIFGRHLFFAHFYIELKMSYLSEVLKQRSDGKENLSVKTCHLCGKNGEGLAVVAEHVGGLHNRAFEMYWEYVKFGCLRESPFLQQVEEEKGKMAASEQVGDNTLVTFQGGDTDEAVNQLRLYAKYGHLPDNTILVQPEACHALSSESELSSCHECYRFLRGRGNDFAICQFEGFRKIRKKVAKPLENALISFCEVTFLDPVQDPVEEDRNLWITIDKYLHPELDRETASFILRYTGTEFCNMVQEEMEVRRNYKGKVYWKRLQPKVREMCDVCSTSLFNYHWTCLTCGIIVCIDCFRTRNSGYPLAYNAKRSDDDDKEEKMMKKPYKSRRIKRPDLDDHYWPTCIGAKCHIPDKFQLTQIICGNDLDVLHKQVHDTITLLGLPASKCGLTETSPKTELASAVENELLSNAQKSLKNLPNIGNGSHSQERKENGNDVKKEVLPSSKNNQSVVTKVNSEILNIFELDQCPICGEAFDEKSRTKLRLGNHFDTHFAAEIQASNGFSPDEVNFSCRFCSHSTDNLAAIRVHVGTEHGAFQSLVNSWQQITTIKQISLKVDRMERCKICNMEYEKHMMTSYTQIRSHVLSHFNQKLLELLPNWLDEELSEDDVSYACLKCGRSEKSKQTFLKSHLAVYHMLLDTLYEKAPSSIKSEKISEKNSNQPVGQTKQRYSLSEYKTRTTSPTMPNTKESKPTVHSITGTSQCNICNVTISGDELRDHIATKHFKKELIDEAKKLLKDPSVCSCGLRTSKVSYKDPWTEVAVHIGRDHAGVLEKLEANLYKLRDHYKSENGQKTQRSAQNNVVSTIVDEVRTQYNRRSMSRESSVEILSTTDEVPIQTGSRRSSVTSVDTSLKRRLSSSNAIQLTKRIRPSDDKVSCIHCDESYNADEYERHMLQHYRPALIEMIGKDLMSSMYCRTCNFQAKTEEDFLHHFADHHQRIKFLEYCQENRLDYLSSGHSSCSMSPEMVENDIIDESFEESENVPNLKKYHCKMRSCKYETRSRSDISLHCTSHIKSDLVKKYNLPRQAPYVCPLCYRESTTSITLLRHFCRSHDFLSDSSPPDSYRPSVVEAEPVPVSTSPDFSMSKVSYIKEESNFVDVGKVDTVGPSRRLESSVMSLKELVNMKTPVSFSDNEEENVAMETQESGAVQEIELHPPPKVAIISNTVSKYPGVPHKWLCEGRLLHLMEPTLPANMGLFHDHWSRGQPVLISNSARHLNQNLWHPKAFLKDFGHLKHDLVNCLSGKTVPKAPLDKFWKGFEKIEFRLKDHLETPMLLKLKDWPPSTDIAEYMPKRFNNLFDSFPMPEYTKREGIRNLAAYLPSYCLKPELGPKMYIAYGSALYSDKASTNLHIDMSDAVNCLVYVSSPMDGNRKEDTKEVYKEIDLASCDILTKHRSRAVLPGALWHIFHPSDTVKIRDLLNKVALEKGKRLDPHDDPIHDQSSYLDGNLRTRLYQEYGVRGYAIVQCAGDTVFIPAGACHQVRNLHNCIKVAEDYVSPENISHCLHLTQEFRHLTEWHTNHEDKLQMKSILYHAVKSAVTVLQKSQ